MKKGPMAIKILVLEDEIDLQNVLKYRLTAAGYEVSMASNGEEGLRMALENRPQLIVTDVLMPKMDGFQFYKSLKADFRTSAIPVIVLTARGKMQDTFLMVGVDSFLVKPFNAEVLLNKVAELLNLPVPPPSRKAPRL